MIVAALATLSLTSGALSGQSKTPAPMARAFGLLSQDDPDRPRLGVSTRSSGKRDTLGLLVEDVTREGPAEKAGIEEGDRLVSINGVNLRVSREDAEDEVMTGIATRRLTRELAKHKAGDDVELRVYRDGQTRTLRAKLVDVEDLEPQSSRLRSLRSALEERATLGVALGGSGSKRDTLGVLVVGVTDSGPAANAGIEEGDRIAAVNGIDLRVDREDAGDWEASGARVRRLNRALEKVKAGDEVELRVYAQGQTRTVRAKTVRSADLRRHGGGMFFDYNFGGVGPFRIVKPAPPARPALPALPALPLKVQPRVYYYDGGGVRVQPRVRIETEVRKLDALRRSIDAKRGTLRLRSNLDDTKDLDEAIATPRSRSPRPSVARIAAAPLPASPAAFRVATASAVMAVEPAVAVASTPAPDADARDALEAAATRVSSYYNGMIGLPGLTLYPVEDDLVSYFGAGSERGLLIVEASDQWRGIREGDVILKIDGRAVRDSQGRVSVVFRDGTKSVIELLRGGKRVSVEIER